jgi:predicted DNA-binding transcriptional regulator AlpA
MSDLAQVVADAERREREDAAKAALSTVEYLSAPQLELLTGTPASTWRYWAHLGTGPASMKIGRRRVWRKTTVLAWLESQEKASV